MDIFKILIFSIICFLGTFSEMNSQITLIPDADFEQALIDLGIDSDGMINGQVFTSDIENIISLDISFESIEDITGIEDFAALEILNVNGNNLSFLNVSNNSELRELYCNSSSAGFSMLMSDLDLSANTNLEILYGENLIFLESLNAKNGNNAILTITLPCEYEGNPCNLDELNCVQVDDETAATNSEPPYDDWLIQANFFYSEDCSLGITSQIENRFSIYPNPTSNLLTIQNQNGLDIESVSLYDALGRKVMENTEATELIDVSNLTAGIYFIHITTDSGIVTKNVIKE